ncbi:MAG: TIGR00730 family Rossman fold protein [Bacteroidales bacterium]|nr:TIGR00730 family Rossman fold protein [Bacteroidales bacterium]
MIQRIAVFCGSNLGASPKYSHAASKLAKSMINKNIELIYGGATVGLMKVLADEYLSAGKNITGIMPRFLKDKQIYQKGLTRNIQVNTMAERKQKLEELSDAFIVMPGGFGTLDESFQILTNGQLGMHQKPLGLLNVDGYFNGLLLFLDKMVEEKFLKHEYRNSIHVSPDPEELLELLESPLPQVNGKWL